MTNSVFIITKNLSILPIIEKNLNIKYKVKIFEDMQSAISSIFDAFPDLIIAEINQGSDPLVKFINDIKTDSIFGQITVLCIIPDDLHLTIWNEIAADDFIRHSDIESDINMRTELSLARLQRIIELNPLTKLPGNISIQKQITQKIQKRDKFAVAYADIDYFKPYNDKYGFSRGDEIIKMLGRLIFNMVRMEQPNNSFVGHVGGDDFIYIMDIEYIEKTSQKIMQEFDKIIPNFYDRPDREKGFIESINREGRKMTFPIMTLSIGIVHNEKKEFKHYGEISQILAEIKQYAKSIKGSFYILDRRG